MRQSMNRLRMVWGKILVFFGLRVWVKPQYNRPKFCTCAYHNTRMKRQRKTEFGAFYYCVMCKKDYHIESKGNKLVLV